VLFTDYSYISISIYIYSLLILLVNKDYHYQKNEAKNNSEKNTLSAEYQ